MTIPPTSLSYHIPQEFESYCGKLYEELHTFSTKDRLEKMERVVKKRSRHVLTVFENTHHGHNVSAILRSLDTFGFLDLFFLYSDPQIRFRAFDTIDRGASQWLFPKRLTSISTCAQTLKENGYKIALVTLPEFSRTSQNYQGHLPSFASHEFFEDKFHDYLQGEKIALIFGNELMGISKEWNALADMYVHVDMCGFSESLNVSVCAGIILHALRLALEKRRPTILLSPFEEKLILEHWIAKDYTPAHRYLSHKKPELLPWFEFVQKGKFLNLDF